MDLAIRGGTVVTAAGRYRSDIGVIGERIAQVGGRVADARIEVDAHGLLVLPGGVDVHAHLTGSERPNRPPRVEDFESGSRAAVVGGITTIGNMSMPRPGESLEAVLMRHRQEAEATSLVDFLLHPVLVEASSERRAELPALAAAGYRSLKIFMSFPEFDRDPADFIEAMAVAAAHRMVTLIHCEDGAIIEHATRRLVDGGRGRLADYAASRPRFSETAAVARAMAMCAATGAATYIVHISSEDALTEIRRARRMGLPVHAEARPLYLSFTEEILKGPEGPLYLGSPPPRTARDREALWEALAHGDIDTCGSDHVAWLRADKADPERDIRSALPGVPELETMMPLLFSEGVRRGRLSLERFVAVTSTNPARIFGIFPHKGTIAPGSDADLVIWDAAESRSVRAATQRSRADHSPYEGISFTGWPRHTIRRGELVYTEGEVVGRPGSARHLASVPPSPVQSEPRRIQGPVKPTLGGATG